MELVGGRIIVYTVVFSERASISGGETMKEQVLVRDQKYRGQYVAVASFSKGQVVASGKDPEVVARRAEKKGVKSPVIIFVPGENLTHIY